MLPARLGLPAPTPRSADLGPRLMAAAYQVVSTTMVLIVLLRIGILASAIMYFVNFLLLRMPLTLDGNAVYSASAWTTAAVVLTLAIAGFRLATTTSTRARSAH